MLLLRDNKAVVSYCASSCLESAMWRQWVRTCLIFNRYERGHRNTFENIHNTHALSTSSLTFHIFNILAVFLGLSVAKTGVPALEIRWSCQSSCHESQSMNSKVTALQAAVVEQRRPDRLLRKCAVTYGNFVGCFSRTLHPWWGCDIISHISITSQKWLVNEDKINAWVCLKW